MQTETGHTTFDIQSVRNSFPILSRKVNQKPLVYFDNGATSQKPIDVIEAVDHYYRFQNSNIHRGVHALSREITIAFEDARKFIADYFFLESQNEIIFTRGTTEGINLVAYGIGETIFKEGSEIIITEMEHHSNILPWQVLCKRKKGILRVLPIDANGEINIEDLAKNINSKTCLIAVTQVSNTLGTINPVNEIVKIAKEKGIPILIDGAQSVPHKEVNLKALDPDFFVFSGHKCFAPTGIGVLFMKDKWIKSFPVYQSGGGTIKTVSFENTEYVDGPLKFEAGTPHIEGVIGLAAALKYLKKTGLKNISDYEHELLQYAEEKLKTIPDLKFIGTAKEKASVLSFIIDGLHPFDVGTLLDQQGIAVRTGHHCTQPLMQKFGIPGTIRASFAFYNTFEEVDILHKGILKSIQLLK